MPIDVCAPSEPPNDGLTGDLLADVRRADLVEAEAAVGLRNLEAQQIELARLLQQLARERPVVRVEPGFDAAAPPGA